MVWIDPWIVQMNVNDSVIYFFQLCPVLIDLINCHNQTAEQPILSSDSVIYHKKTKQKQFDVFRQAVISFSVLSL